MCNDQAQCLIRPPHILGVALGNRFRVQRMRQALPLQQSRSGKTRPILPFVDRDRINHIGLRIRTLRDGVGKKRAQIGGVFATPCLPQFSEHCVVDAISTAGQRAQQSTPSNHTGKRLEIEPLCRQLPFDQHAAEFLLFENRPAKKARHLFIAVAQRCDMGSLFVHKQTDFGRSRSGIDRQDSEFSGLHR